MDEVRGEDGASRVGVVQLRSGAGLEVEVVREGAALRACRIPDRDGAPADVVLGFDTGPEYATRNAPYFGCVVGRVAGRIAGARFRLPDGSEHLVSRNHGAHCLHVPTSHVASTDGSWSCVDAR